MSSPLSSESTPWSSIYSLPLFSAAAAATAATHNHYPHHNHNTNHQNHDHHTNINPLNLYTKFNFDSMVERFHELQQQLINHHRPPPPPPSATTTELPFHRFIDSEVLTTRNTMDKLCTPIIPSNSSVFVIKNGKEIIDDDHQFGKHHFLF
mgnify:CR=1 FL=1